MSAARKPTKRTRKSPQEMLDALQGRLDATPERLARAKDAGQTPTRGADRTRRLLDPFDTMRANRVLAPNDPKLNDIRWLVGESLRRTHHRARLDQRDVDVIGHVINELWCGVEAQQDLAKSAPFRNLAEGEFIKIMCVRNG